MAIEQRVQNSVAAAARMQSFAIAMISLKAIPLPSIIANLKRKAGCQHEVSAPVATVTGRRFNVV